MPDDSETVALLREIRDLQREQLAFDKQAAAAAVEREAVNRTRMEERTAAALRQLGEVRKPPSGLAQGYAAVAALAVAVLLYLVYLKFGR